MSKKVKLSVTLPDGEVATRTTARAYTHVLAIYSSRAREVARAEKSIASGKELYEGGHRTSEWLAERIAEEEAWLATIPESGKWYAISWHGSYELAAKALKARAGKPWANEDAAWIIEVPEK